MKKTLNSLYSSLYTCVLILLLIFGCKEEEPVPAPNEDEGGTPPAPVSISPRDLLSSETFESLVVEIQFISDYQPSSRAVDNLKSFLENRLNKPAGITILQREIESPGHATYSLSQIRELERQERTKQAEGNTAALYFFFADGDYAGNSGDSKILGIAYGSSSMVIFEKTLQDYSGGLAQPSLSSLETTVIQHEVGHIIGLVNNGSPMQVQHQDEPHGKHCNNKDCLMYYAVETSDIISQLTGGDIPQLDVNCLHDLQANGGK